MHCLSADSDSGLNSHSCDVVDSVDEVGRRVLGQLVERVQSPADRATVDSRLLSGLHVSGFIADVDDASERDRQFAQQPSQGTSFSGQPRG